MSQASDMSAMSAQSSPHTDIMGKYKFPITGSRDLPSLRGQTLEILEANKHILGAGIAWVTYIFDERSPYMIIIMYDKAKVTSDCIHDFDGNRPTGVKDEYLRRTAINIRRECLDFFHETSRKSDDAAINDHIVNNIIMKYACLYFKGNKHLIRASAALLMSRVLEIMKKNHTSTETDTTISGSTTLSAQDERVANNALITQNSKEDHYKEDDYSVEFTLKQLKEMEKEEEEDEKEDNKERMVEVLERVVKKGTQSAVSTVQQVASQAISVLQQRGEELKQKQDEERKLFLLANPVKYEIDQGVSAEGFDSLQGIVTNSVQLSHSLDKALEIELSETGVKINTCFIIGLFAISPISKSHPTIFIEPFTTRSLRRDTYQTKSTFFHGTSTTPLHTESNLRASIHDVAKLVFDGHITPLMASMTKFIADRLCIQSHLFKLLGIIKDAVEYVPVSHDGRAFLDNLTINLLCRERGFLGESIQLKELHIPGVFARMISREDYLCIGVVPEFRELSPAQIEYFANLQRELELEKEEKEEKKRKSQEAKRVKDEKRQATLVVRLNEVKKAIDEISDSISKPDIRRSTIDAKLKNLKILFDFDLDQKTEIVLKLNTLKNKIDPSSPTSKQIDTLINTLFKDKIEGGKKNKTKYIKSHLRRNEIRSRKTKKIYK